MGEENMTKSQEHTNKEKKMFKIRNFIKKINLLLLLH